MNHSSWDEAGCNVSDSRRRFACQLVLTSTPHVKGRPSDLLERASGDRFAHPLHQVQRPGDVVQAEQPAGGRLAGLEQVAEVATAVAPAHLAAAGGVDRLVADGV